jgi:hypothetical protein
MTAYIDNNILIYIENGSLTISDLKERISPELTDFFLFFSSYSRNGGNKRRYGFD